MTHEEFGALLVLATAMSFTPGPNTTLSTALAANHGLRGAWRFCLAVPVGWTVLLLVSGAGFGALVTTVPPLRLALKAAGIAYLAWLAWRLAHAGALGRATAPARVGFVQGVLLQFVNIKAWMLALTIVAGWVALPGAAARELLGRMAVVLPVMACFAFGSNLTYALVGALLRRWLAQGRRLLWFNRGMAGVLVGTATWMATV